MPRHLVERDAGQRSEARLLAYVLACFPQLVQLGIRLGAHVSPRIRFSRHMIAVVTGSTGFIGSHLVDALLTRGATVRALARPDTPPSALDPRIEHWTADPLDDRSVREAGCWDGATHVFHLAGVTKRRTLAQFRDGNVVPTANLLAAAVAHAGDRPPRVVLVSSQAAAGPARAPDAPVNEEDQPSPIEGYGRSKLEAELAARPYEGRLPVTVIRPAAVYGPRDRDFLRVFRLAARAVALHAVPRDNLFSLVHVHDLVAAILLAADHPKAVGRTYFVANETPVTWRALYAAIAEATSAKRAVELQIPLPAVALAGLAGDVVSTLTGWHSLANGHKTKLARPRWWLCDASRARAELGWRETVALQDGVRETYLWYLQAGWMRARQARPGAVPSEESRA
jgi:nucleoside-diphosphate-sugar epimerase